MKNIIFNKTRKKQKVLSVFDFDGTLTHYNSFILFLQFAFGKCYFISHLIHMVLPTLQCIQKRNLNHDELKKILIKTFLTDISEDWLHKKSKDFCEKYWKKLMRSKGVLAVKTEINLGAEVIICSASPTLVLRPFSDKLGVKLIGTQLEVKHGKLTGFISGYNCRCAQKVKRLERIYGNLNNYYLRAWGDTKGDYELLALACDSYWRYFHKTHKRMSFYSCFR